MAVTIRKRWRFPSWKGCVRAWSVTNGIFADSDMALFFVDPKLVEIALLLLAIFTLRLINRLP